MQYIHVWECMLMCISYCIFIFLCFCISEYICISMTTSRYLDREIQKEVEIEGFLQIFLPICLCHENKVSISSSFCMMNFVSMYIPVYNYQCMYLQELLVLCALVYVFFIFACLYTYNIFNLSVCQYLSIQRSVHMYVYP